MSSDSAPEGYRRRSRWPALIIIGILLVATAITWAVVLKPEPAADNSCNVPGVPTSTARTTTSAAGTAADSNAATDPNATAGPNAGPNTDPNATAAQGTTSTSTTASTTLGQFTDKNTLKDTRPAAPATVALRVVNASSTPGMAKTVTETLRKAGFESILTADDDPLYPASDLRCYGEIRYGLAGSAAARTVLIVAPCATLVVEPDRLDGGVEFAIGALYEDSGLTDDQTAQLVSIAQAAQPPAVIEGVTQAAQPAAAIPALPTTATCPS